MNFNIYQGSLVINRHYQQTVIKLQSAVEAAVAELVQHLAQNGLKNSDEIPQQPLAVDIVAGVLAQCLAEERLALLDSTASKQQAEQEAFELIKTAVINYRAIKRQSIN